MSDRSIVAMWAVIGTGLVAIVASVVIGLSIGAVHQSDARVAQTQVCQTIRDERDRTLCAAEVSAIQVCDDIPTNDGGGEMRTCVATVTQGYPSVVQQINQTNTINGAHP